MKEQKFRKLDVWQKAMDLVERVYKLTNYFPSNELYGLTSQLKRAATSIALNIAEGSGTGSDSEFGRFLSIAHRSSYELMCGFEIAKRLKYIREDDLNSILKECNELSAMVFAFKKKLKADS